MQELLDAGSHSDSIVDPNASLQCWWALKGEPNRFRSVVHSDILSERPATLAIILMSRPIGFEGMLQQAREVPE